MEKVREETEGEWVEAEGERGMDRTCSKKVRKVLDKKVLAIFKKGTHLSKN